MQKSWLCRSFGRLALGVLVVSGLGTALAKEYQFAVIPKLRAPWFNRLEVGTKKAAQDLGVKTYMQAPASADEAEQARLIQDAIRRGVDAVLVVPNNAQSLEPVFAQAKQAGIVVITHESPNQKNADFDIEMIDNEKFGQAALELLAQGLGGKGDFAGGGSVLRHCDVGSDSIACNDLELFSATAGLGVKPSNGNQLKIDE